MSDEPKSTPQKPEQPPATERLAKVMAEHGVASRREAEKIVTDGRVEVNGAVVTHPGTPVSRSDTIRVDGRPLPTAPRKIYLLFYKPKGTIVTRADPEGRDTIWQILPELPARVEAVGRLDVNTEGALLLTNDGDLANALTHPSREVPKRYLAKVWKEPSESDLKRLMSGVLLEDGKTAPCKARVVRLAQGRPGSEARQPGESNCWVEITVTEGKNRLVRRMLTAIGHPVSKLRRESFATVSIRDLAPGQLRPLTAEEIDRVRDVSQGVIPSAAGRRSRSRKMGHAKADPGWIQRRENRKKKPRRA